MNDIPDWKKALDLGTSMHTVLAEKKSKEGPEWIQTPEEQEIVWEINKFAVEHFGKSKWSAIKSKLKMELIYCVSGQAELGLLLVTTMGPNCSLLTILAFIM